MKEAGGNRRREQKGRSFALESRPVRGRVEEKRNKRHSDGRGARGRVQAEMQVQVQIGCSFSLALIPGPLVLLLRPVCGVVGAGVWRSKAMWIAKIGKNHASSGKEGDDEASLRVKWKYRGLLRLGEGKRLGSRGMAFPAACAVSCIRCRRSVERRQLE